MLRASCQAFVITAACLITVVKLRNQGLSSPFLTTQEINRCLSVLRAASAANGTTDNSLRRRSKQLSSELK